MYFLNEILLTLKVKLTFNEGENKLDFFLKSLNADAIFFLLNCPTGSNGTFNKHRKRVGEAGRIAKSKTFQNFQSIPTSIGNFCIGKMKMKEIKE
jgi:hypothetical protein